MASVATGAGVGVGIGIGAPLILDRTVSDDNRKVISLGIQGLGVAAVIFSMMSSGGSITGVSTAGIFMGVLPGFMNLVVLD